MEGDRIVLWRDVFSGKGSISGLSKSTGIALVKNKTFPAPFFVSPGRQGWMLSTVMKALQELSEAEKAS